MASLNKVTLIGNLGRDPELRSLPSGDSVCNISIATTEKWKDKQTGEMQEATEWHRVSLFGRMAEIAGEYLRQGSSVYIEGSIRTRKYNDKDGVEKYSTEIRADEMKMLGSPNGGNGGNQRSQGTQQGNQRQAAPQQQRNQGGQGYGGNNQRQQAPAQSAGQRANQGRTNAPAGGRSGFDDMDDDIPF